MHRRACASLRVNDETVAASLLRNNFQQFENLKRDIGSLRIIASSAYKPDAADGIIAVASAI